MNVSIAKKLERLEKRFSVRNSPSLITISYEAGEGVYIVRERYCKFDGRGNVTEGGYSRNRKIKALEEYVIPPEFTAQIVLNLMECERPIVTSVNALEVRKAGKIGKAPFAFVSVLPSDHEKEAFFEIAVYE